MKKIKEKRQKIKQDRVFHSCLDIGYWILDILLCFSLGFKNQMHQLRPAVDAQFLVQGVDVVFDCGERNVEHGFDFLVALTL